MFFSPGFVLLSLSLALTASAVSIGPTAELTISNVNLAPDGYLKQGVLANGIFPGPTLVATKGQTYEFNVVNKLTNESFLKSTTIHWHGLFEQDGFSWADGPSFVTQCPIATNHSFLYQVPTTSQAGTFWYHSHLHRQYCDGLRGAMVIYDPADPHLGLYDVDDDATVITLSDWYHEPAATIVGAAVPDATLINGLGRYINGPASALTVFTVTKGVRYRYRLVSISCDPNYVFSIDNHTMTIIEVDGTNHNPLTVDSIQIFAGQRYSFVLTANQPVANYWVRTVPSSSPVGFAGGVNSAIMRYVGAPDAEPSTLLVASVNPLVETDLHPSPGAAPVPGKPFVGGADKTIQLQIGFAGGLFSINNVSFVNPTVPVLLQILSGAQSAADLLPSGSIYVLPPNSVIEVNIPGGALAAPHPIHLHGHNFHVIRSVGNATYNFDNPVIRDVVNTGPDTSDNVTFRFVTNNAGPWFLHCHIDFHLDAGLAAVFVEDPAGVLKEKGVSQPAEWDALCPTYDALSSTNLR